MKPGSLWPYIIGAALALHVIGSLAMVYLATSNPSHAVEPDYYNKALAWDEKREQDRRNVELGWTLDFVVEPATPGNDPTLRATLSDTTGAPVGDATIGVEAFANVRRDEIVTTTLSPSARGYESQMPLHRNGRWEFRFRVTRDSDVFTYWETRHVWTEIER
jgi:hypothetical protein